MTEYLIEEIERYKNSDGVIVVQAFDNIAEEYLSQYETVIKTPNQLIVTNIYGKRFIVLDTSKVDAYCGKRTSHLIVDKRIDDKYFHIAIYPMMRGYNKKIELF